MLPPKWHLCPKHSRQQITPVAHALSKRVGVQNLESDGNQVRQTDLLANHDPEILCCELT